VSNAAIRDIDALTPDTAAKCRLFLQRSKAAGLEVFVTETRRSFERQAALWAIGRTLPGRIVTRSKAGTGKHEFGLAFDVAFKGVNLYPSDAKTWARLGSIGKACGLTWGGDFKGVDSVHFENNGGSIMAGDVENGGVAGPVVQAGTAAVAAPATAKTVTLKDVAKYSGLVVLALPYLATFFPQYALFFKAVGAFIGVLGA